MIDTHCHLDLYPKPGPVIAEADKRGMFVIAVTTTPKAFLGNMRMIEGRKRIRVAVGLHPELVAERHREVEDVCQLMAKTKYVGEIGIDGSPPHKSSIKLQTEVFSRFLTRASELGGKILSIHSRGAAALVLDEIERNGMERCRSFIGSVARNSRSNVLPNSGAGSVSDLRCFEAGKDESFLLRCLAIGF